MSHRLFWCPHVPWSPWNMSYGALTTCPMESFKRVPWSPTTCPMEPSQLSHGALHIWPVLLKIFHWDFGCPSCPIVPCGTGWDGMGLSQAYHPLLTAVPWSPRRQVLTTSQHVPRSLHMSHGALQHVPWIPHNMSRGTPATCPMSHGALTTCPMGPS